jgi:predicted dehydrogenase
MLAQSAAVAVGAVVTPYIWTSRQAMAAESKNDRFNVAAIGTGGRGSFIGNQAGSRGNMLACCDVDRRRAEGFASRYDGSCQVYGDYRQVLDRKDIELVTIGTPDHWHAKIAVEAMRAGKDVYCEKPLTLTIEEGKLLCRTVKETGRVLQVGTQQRSEFNGVFLLAVALARSGRLGQRLRAKASVGQAKQGGPFAATTPPTHLDWDFWLGPAPRSAYCPERSHYDFRWWFEYAGGQVTSWGVNHVDIALWALGLEGTGPIEVRGTGRFPSIPNGFNVPTTFQCEMEFADGRTIELDSDKNRLEIAGEKGRIFVDRRRLSGEPVENLSKTERERLQRQANSLCRGKLPGSHMANFFDCVKDRSLPISDAFTHHRALTACHLCNIAMKLDRPVRWDPAREDIVGDPEATALLARPQREPYGIEA